MNNTWNLKLFISLSLGLHLFVLFLLSILIPDFKITQLPRLNIEVSLLSIAREERELPRKVEKRVIVRSEKKESLKTVEKREMEIKNESPMSNHEERKISQVEKAEVALPQKELEPIATAPVHHEVKVVSISEPKLSPLANEKKEIENKQEERIVVASLGNPIPSVSPPEKPHTAMKSPSLSESDIIFAQPRYAENPKPLYPWEAKKKGVEGEVLLRVEVLSNGRVGEVEVKRSSGHEVLDRSAIKTVKQWKFIPAKKGETPVPVWVNIPVAFQLR